MSSIILQTILSEAEAELVEPLYATIAEQTAEIADHATQITAQAATIAAQAAELATFHPVPTSNNTGFRGGLTSAGVSLLTGAADATIENRQIAYPTAFSGANVTLKNDRVYTPSASVLDGSASTGFAMIDTVIVGGFKGAGAFTKCNMASLELTGPSIVTDCYIPGGITGYVAGRDTITNTTVTP